MAATTNAPGTDATTPAVVEPAGNAAACKSPAVSVIVPVYNVARYLDQALTSLEAQTLRDIEIICVNDGSTDESPSIMRAHAQRDARISVIDKPNGGYGSACNCGLAAARGTWIAILEPDDWIDVEMYERMVEYAASFDVPADVIKTPYWRVMQPDTPDERMVNCSYKGLVRPKAQPFKLTDAGAIDLIVHHPSIWSALYRRDFLEGAGIRFREIPGAGWADNPFLYETLCQARRIVYLDRAFYRYREETPERFKASVRRNPHMLVDRWNDMADVLDRLRIEDEAVRRALVRRGFTYLDNIATSADLWRPGLRDAAIGMLERMDAQLVMTEPHIPPRWKREFARLRGLDDAIGQTSGVRTSAPYWASLAKTGLYNLANVGPALTLKSVAGFASRGASDEPATLETPPVREGTPLLSIVMPVYNSERYLDESLNSLVAQTWAGFEVVCVDDGSTDASPSILAHRAQADPRIRIVTKPNGGPSSARNVGIDNACGCYVMFLDSDDALEPHACERLACELAGLEDDVAVFGWSCFDGVPDHWTAAQGDVRSAFYPAFSPQLLEDEHVQPFLRLAVRRSLLAEKEIRFDETLYLGEDAAFLFSLFPHAQNVRLLPSKLLRYRLPHAGSIMHGVSDDAHEECLQGFNVVASVFDNWKACGLDKSYPKALFEWSVRYSLYTILRQEAPLRDELAALMAKLWRTCWTDAQIDELDAASHVLKLARPVLAGDFEAAARALPAYRLAEYGAADAALRLLDRIR